MDIVKRNLRKRGIRKKIVGTKERPRLSVYRSSKHIYAAIVDDTEGKTLLSANEKDIKAKASQPTKKEKAFMVGKILAEKALKKGLKKVVFDRAGYLYHGRVRKLAEGAREGGLKF